MSLGPAEILVVLTVALILVGRTWLPEVSRQVGGARRELRRIHDTVRSEIRSVIDGHVGPVPRMTSHEPPLAEPLPAFTAGEPDVGDRSERPVLSEPVADHPAPGFEVLARGTFS